MSRAMSIRSDDGKPTWVVLEADDYKAMLPAESLLAYTGSYLAERTELALRDCEHEPPAIRLNCSPAVLKEVVEYLRSGSGYYMPVADPHLRFKVRSQLDYLGIASLPPKEETLCLVELYSHPGIFRIYKYQLDPTGTGLTVASGSVHIPSATASRTCPSAVGGHGSCSMTWTPTRVRICPGVWERLLS